MSETIDSPNGLSDSSNQYSLDDVDVFLKEVFGARDLTELSNLLDRSMVTLIEYLHSIQKIDDKSPPRVHHINPVFALSNFCEGTSRETYRLMQHSRGERNKKKAERVAFVKDINKAKDMFPDDPYVIERFYSKIETVVSEIIKDFKIAELKDIQSQIDSLTLFLGMQITRSLRQRVLLHDLAKSSVDNAVKEIESSFIFSDEERDVLNDKMDDMALLYSLRHIILHTFDLRNRSVIFISSEKSKLVNAPEPALFLDEKFERLDQQTINSTLWYPLTRNLLVMFPKRSSIDGVKECHHIVFDEAIDLYNAHIFNQSLNHEIFIHPEDENQIIEYIRTFELDYNPTPSIENG